MCAVKKTEDYQKPQAVLSIITRLVRSAPRYISCTRIAVQGVSKTNTPSSQTCAPLAGCRSTNLLSNFESLRLKFLNSEKTCRTRTLHPPPSNTDRSGVPPLEQVGSQGRSFANISVGRTSSFSLLHPIVVEDAPRARRSVGIGMLKPWCKTVRFESRSPSQLPCGRGRGVSTGVRTNFQLRNASVHFQSFVSREASSKQRRTAA